MSVASKTKLIKKLANKEYRDAYAEESVKTSLPFQIKAMREQRDWSQEILGKRATMKQNAVSRLESAEYGNLNISTLLRLANAFDCGLLVKFVPFSRLIKEFNDVSSSALEVNNFHDDAAALERLTAETGSEHYILPHVTHTGNPDLDVKSDGTDNAFLANEQINEVLEIESEETVNAYLPFLDHTANYMPM